MHPSTKYTTLLLLLFIQSVFAQELPPVRNFSTIDYESGNQNWSIAQSKDKLIYVANNDGLLEYNGAKWTKYTSPNETIMRSVQIIGDRIYTGCYMEFGYWERSNLGVLVYTSISNTIDQELKEDEEFWNIIGIDDWVVFQSLSRIYIYNTSNRTTRIIESDDAIVKMFKINETIYFQRINQGIFKVENGQDVLFLDDDPFRTDEIVSIFPDSDGLLILTRNSGFYRYQNQKVSAWLEANSVLEDVSIYNAIKLSNNNFALGTISDGLIHLSNNGTINYHISQSNGLGNNTVLSLHEDLDQNIWLGLDNGISFININTPLKIYRDKNGLLGSVYASAIHNDLLYLGTNQGLFYRALDNPIASFKMIAGTQGQVWSLKRINGTLFCGHHTGTFTVSDGQVTKVSEVQGTWSVESISDNPDLLIQGNYDGLYLLERQNRSWRLKQKIEGFENSSRHFAILNKKILVNHEYKGIFHLSLNDDYTQITDIKIDTLLMGANSGIIRYQDKIMYAYRDGIFTYNPTTESFKLDSTLSTIYNPDNYVSGRIVPNENQDQFWIFTRDNLTLVTSGNLLNVPKLISVPISSEIRGDVQEYENIISLNGQNQFLLGTSNGYLTIDIELFNLNDFNTRISSIGRGINLNHSDADILLDKDVEGSFEHFENNFRFYFHTAAYFDYLRPSYQFQLVGLYDEWSQWSNDATVFYENLPPGDYTFNVRAKIGDKLSENTASYEFKIAKPWYITNLMIGIYGLGVILFSIFMHNVYRRYYKTQQQKLIEENKRELELAKLQNEKEIIKIKNDQLKEDYKSKSKELAASIMSIVAKNQVLTQIKDSLVKVDDKSSINPVIKIIDKSLDHNKNWELFKEAFDNADSEFFKNLKDTHPNLSPNDLKLCAYLRLNLSSKEIAHLINISPRSVEIKRYRLRKKLDLANEENLTNYILSI